ncbi:hypothetical protein C4K14_2178 [Pseudomonas chlororaphis subsp. aureofaciens]|uniref:phage tail protein n=1 Tax=Pseudomonas chlororaphis TaxID=587753 RepID=UPI000F55C63F|nr:phage tail protein [Pseudomonas chlororaphis]AZD85012.1 hypothetical protein C4K14_2178 [Pseudomonas chlororaphis subsp. aureofaciens]
MSLLDTFTILFESDVSTVDDGLSKSKKGSDDLIDSLKKADKQADQTGESFAGYATKALAALTAALSVGQIISGTIQKAQDITAIAQTAEALGEAVEDVDAFGRAAVAAGGDAQGARDSLTDMAEKIGEALSDTESGAAKAFSSLKIGLKDAEGQSKGAIAGVLDLAGAVEGMSKSEAVFKIKELGITDNRTVEMVLKGRKELERMLAVQKEQGVITKEAVENAKKLTEGMNKLRGALDVAGTGFMTSLIPALTKGVEWLTKLVDWAGEHSDFIVGFFMAIGAAVAVFYIPPMVAAAAATLAATWPIIAIGAAVAAMAALFALAYDDIMNFIDGNDSLIGQVFEKYPAVKAVVFSIIEVFKSLGGVVAEIWAGIIRGFKQVIDFVMQGVKQIASGISTVASFFGIGSDDEKADGERKSADNPDGGERRPRGPLPSGSGQGSEDVPMVDGQEDGRPRVSTFPSGSGQARGDIPMIPGREEGAPRPAAFAGVAAGRSAMTTANASPLNSTTSNAISNSVSSSKETNVQTGDIIIQTQATDAKGIASDVGGELGSQLKQLDSEFSTGVDR